MLFVFFFFIDLGGGRGGIYVFGKTKQGHFIFAAIEGNGYRKGAFTGEIHFLTGGD